MPSSSKPSVAQAMAGTDPILSQLRNSLTGPTNNALMSFVQILRNNFATYSWVGVYLVDGDNLALEAYAGDGVTEHVIIPMGQGICGAAAQTGETITVGDVSQDPRYLMCFPSTRSEIVVPITTSKGVIGEIDIDSDKLAAFSRKDRAFLERAAKLLAAFLDHK